MKPNFQAAFDPEEALSIVEGDRELFLELVKVFRGSYPTELSWILDAIQRRDPEALRRASHHLKGTLSALAAGPARAAALRLEDCGRTTDLTPAAGLYVEMEQQVAALEAALTEWMK